MNLLNPWHSIHLNSLAFHRFRASFVPFLMSVDLAGGTALYCRQAPEEGGATCFADAASAWEGLAFDQQRHLLLLGTIDISRDNYATCAIYMILCHLCFGTYLKRSILLNTADAEHFGCEKGPHFTPHLLHCEACYSFVLSKRMIQGYSGSGAMVPLRKLDCICSLAHHDAKLRKRNPDYPMLTEEDPLKIQDEMISCIFMLFLWVETLLKLNPPSPDESKYHWITFEWARMDPKYPNSWIQMHDAGISLEGFEGFDCFDCFDCFAQSLQERKRNPPRRVPLSLQHPETGRRAIYGINSSTCFVVEKGQEPWLILYSLLITYPSWILPKKDDGTFQGLKDLHAAPTRTRWIYAKHSGLEEWWVAFVIIAEIDDTIITYYTW